MQIGATVQLRDFYPRARKDITVPRPSNLFLPDGWTSVLARGLSHITFKDQHVLEVGVGTAINLAGLLTHAFDAPSRFTGTDICNDAITAARQLADREELAAELLVSDLLADVPDTTLATVTHIFACIPQVPKPADVDLSEGDAVAHYYEPSGSAWDDFGLGLNSELIAQATARAPQAALTLNLSGRPGIERLQQLFAAHGRDAIVLHEEIVSQHAETSLEAFAALEAAGHEAFGFYSDAAAADRISATEAEERRINKRPVFHKIHVMSARPL